MRDKVIGAGFRAIRLTRIDRLVSGLTRGLGAILMFHHVRPASAAGGYAPNRLLEITPAFFDEVLSALTRQGFEIVTLDAAVERIRKPVRSRNGPFAVLTFDDGYRDNRDHALPIMRKHGAPFTMFVTTGFAERTARVWWKELELAIAATPVIEMNRDGQALRFPCGDDAEKTRTFTTLYRWLRLGPEERLLEVIADLCARYGVDRRAIVDDLCMDFDEIAALAADPLCTIGAHTLTHPMLAKHDIAMVAREIGESRAILEDRLGRPVRHMAYPVGDPGSAGTREFAAARAASYESAVTTRPGMVFAQHADHLTALPRLSVNGCWQDIRHVESLLSGAPFALWNRGRRLNVA